MHLHSGPELGVVLRHVYDTLIYRDPATRQFVSGLATSWSISEDGRVYTFELRTDVRFHDGTTLDATAVAVNLDRITNPENRPNDTFSLLGPYVGYTVLSRYRIQLELDRPYAPFLDALSQYPLSIASPNALGSYSNLRYQFHQVGTGPYRFVDFIPDRYVILERNEAYTWGPAFYERTADNPIDRIEFRLMADEDRTLALENGQVDLVSLLEPQSASQLITNAEFQVIPAPIAGQPMQLIMNTAQYPTDNRLIRQALIVGTNRSEIVDRVLRGFSPVAWAPITTNTLFFNAGLVNEYAFSLEGARSLIEEAGFNDSDQDGYYDIDGIRLSVRLIAQPGDLNAELVNLLRSQWRIIGIDVDVQVEPTQAGLQAAVESGEYNLVMAYEQGLDPIFLGDYFLSDSDRNWTAYEDPNLDRTFFEAASQMDLAARAATYGVIQQNILDNALVLPIYEPVRLYGVNLRIRELSFDASGQYPLLVNVDLATASE